MQKSKLLVHLFTLVFTSYAYSTEYYDPTAPTKHNEFSQEGRYKLNLPLNMGFQQEDIRVGQGKPAPADKNTRTYYNLLFTSLGESRTQYLGQAGLIEFKDRFFPKTSFSKLYDLLRVELAPYDFDSLRWPMNAPTTNVQELLNLRNQLLNENGRVKSSYRFQAGLEVIATIKFGTNIDVARNIVKQALTQSEYRSLYWKEHSDITKNKSERSIYSPQVYEENQRLIRQIDAKEALQSEQRAKGKKEAFLNKVTVINADGAREPQAFLKGRQGYVQAANKHFNGNMTEAYQTLKSKLHPHLFAKFGWGEIFRGEAHTFALARELVKNDRGHIDTSKWYGFGEETLNKAAKELKRRKGDISFEVARKSMLSALTPTEREVLGWDFESKTAVERKIETTKNQKIVDPKASVRKGLRR